METLLKLEEISTSYRTFVDDQVLTATHLNEVVDYFEDQHRLTRICLSGVGIVCGLNVVFNRRDTIEVTMGCGVTTDGDLIKYQGAIHQNFKTFDDKAKYERFEGLELLELVPNTDEDVDDHESITAIEDLDNKVVLLYLEHFEEKVADCTTTDCDTQGKPQHANIKILLIDKDDAERISSNELDPIFFKHNQTKNFLGLPEIDVRRMILRNSYLTDSNGNTYISPASNTKNYTRLKQSYASILKSSNAVSDLKKGVSILFKSFSELLSIDTLPIDQLDIQNRIDALFNLNLKNVPIDIQYRYDLLKDLINTYDEIKHLLFDLRTECCPDKHSFPKHLLLGELFKEEKYYQCRHSFYPSPIIPHGQEKLQEIRALLYRFSLILSEYSVTTTARTAIKITPSVDYDRILSERAIPYYYLTSEKLVNSWSYYLTNRCKSGENMAYHRSNLSPRNAVQNPLDHNIDHKDFFRIEGHLGKDYRTAMREIDSIKTSKGLPFELKALSIDETLDGIDPDDYKCHFEDLNAVLQAWRSEQRCLYANAVAFFSGFNIFSPYTTNWGASYDHVPNYNIATLYNAKFVEAAFAKQYQDACFDNTYYQDTVVLDYMTAEEGTLGNMMGMVMAENRYASADTIITKTKELLENNDAYAEWDEEARLVSAEHPMTLLANMLVVTNYNVEKLADISAKRVVDYDQAIKQLCDRIEQIKAYYGRTHHYTTNRTYHGYEQQYALLLNQLSINCCAAEKMEVLLKEIQKRKLEILESKLLSKFTEKHPGLEHKAGVPSGGTFVLVYKGAKKPKYSRATLEAASRNLRVSEEVLFHRNLDYSAYRAAYTADNVAMREDIREDVMLSDNVTAELSIAEAANAGRALVARDNVTEYTVVADFALPYSCCSDCAPVAFIVPQQPVSLRLPVDHICRNDDTQPIAFEVVPADGVVTAEVDSGNGGVVVREGRYFFDAHQPDVPVGEEIRFRVNDQITDCRIIVFEMPQFSITVVNQRPGTQNGRAFVDVSFQVESEDTLPEDVSFFWEFGDDNTSREENPRHRYFLPVNDDNSVTPRLTITNGRCSHTEEGETLVFEVDPEINFDGNTRCIDANREADFSISFNVQPANATVAIMDPVPEGARIENSRVVLSPSFDTYGVPLRFTVNGEAMPETLSIGSNPYSHLFCLAYRQDTDDPDTEPNNLFMVGAATSETETWTYEWDIELFDEAGNLINNPEIAINNNYASWDVDLTGSSSANVRVIVSRSFGEGVFSCSQTLISNGMSMREQPCAKTYFAYMNLLKETTIDNIDELSTSNEVLAEMKERVLALFRFFTRPENERLYRPANRREALDIFLAFYNDNADWTPDNINTEQDLELFGALLSYVYLFAFYVLSCPEQADLSEINEVLAIIGERFADQAGSGIAGRTNMIRVDPASRSLSETDTIRLNEIRRINLVDLRNERFTVSDLDLIIRRLND